MRSCEYGRLGWSSIGTFILILEVTAYLSFVPKETYWSLLIRFRFKSIVWCYTINSIGMLSCFCLYLCSFFRQVVGYGKKWNPIPLLLVYLLVLGLDIAFLYMVTNAICLVAWQMKVKIQTTMFPGTPTLFQTKCLFYGLD